VAGTDNAGTGPRGDRQSRHRRTARFLAGVIDNIDVALDSINSERATLGAVAEPLRER
jgi:flagellin-like hook-associated protein FlgL